MRTPLRLAGTLAVCVLAVAFTGCGSNNTGKIVGKWKMVASTAKGMGIDELKSKGIAMVWDFKADGTFAIELAADNDSPETKAAVQLANAMMKQKDTNGSYKLGIGDRVSLTMPEENGKKTSDSTNVTIAGDSMTWKDSDGTTASFTRMK